MTVFLISEAVLFAVVIFCDLLIGYMSFRQKSVQGRGLGAACICAAGVTLSYLISVFVENYFLYSVLSSLYFIGIDLALLILGNFVRHFVRGGDAGQMGIGWRFLHLWGVVDIVMLAVNPFYEVSIHYAYVRAPISHYTYEMLLPYQMHLLLSYVLLAVIIVYLVKRMLSVPSVYRRQYYYALLTLVLVILINAVYLYVPTPGAMTSLDYSLLGYSVAAILFYWICFSYVKRGLLDLIRLHLFESIDRGILMFDFENKLIMKNDLAEKILARLPWVKNPTVADVAELLSDDPEDVQELFSNQDGERNYSFQCYPPEGTQMNPIRCDYSLLFTPKHELLGRLFLFSELTSEYDSLTGFHAWEIYKNKEGMEIPADITVAACDINGLTELNNLQGRSEGDRVIQTLARVMRKAFPQDTLFVRGRDAILVAVCRGRDEEALRGYVERMQEMVSADIVFQSGIRKNRENETCANTIRGAMDALRMKKLLDQSSHHSDLLYSLVQALQECDKDTEAHVRRTQKLGMKLGQKIGLTDTQQSNLALLAILHDIGKIGIPLDILNKPGKLSEIEWNVMMTHVEKGYQIANSSAELKGIADMILYHHERWDGKGYPDGLSKESIPLLSRMIAVVDAFDAMVNDRPYRKGMPPENACQELRRCAGTQFDPSLVANFIQLLEEESIVSPSWEEADSVVEKPQESEFKSPWYQETEKNEEQQVPRIHVMRHAHFVVGGEGRIIRADEMFFRLTGYEEKDVQDGRLYGYHLIFEEDQKNYEEVLFKQLTGGSTAYMEHWMKRKDGSAIYVFSYVRRFFHSALRLECLEFILSDSASSYSVRSMVQNEQNKASRRLERWENKFRRDSLTGLLNHEAFRNDVEARLLSGNQNVLMLMMDVDRFKEYNDTYGHRAGDEFLVMVAQTLMSALKKDDFACRMGGDEFAAALFFRDDSMRDAMKARATQICDKLNLTLTSLNGGGTSLSMGGAFYEESHATFDRLYEAADRALYQSKESGRAKVSFYS